MSFPNPIRSILSSLFDAESVFRFQVLVDDIYLAAFTEFQMPDLSVEMLDVTEGGQNTFVHKLPVRLNVGPATLKQGITSDLSLLKWYMQVVNGNVTAARRQVSVIMFSPLGIPVLVFSFRDAYPIKWVAPNLNTEQNSVAIEELHFVHHGFTIENLQQSFSTSSSSG
jgi:phage tail-like protein